MDFQQNHLDGIDMEIRDTDIGISRCDNHACNQLLLGIAIAFETPHGEIEICAHCVIKAKDIVSAEDRRIVNEANNSND